MVSCLGIVLAWIAALGMHGAGLADDASVSSQFRAWATEFLDRDGAGELAHRDDVCAVAMSAASLAVDAGDLDTFVRLQRLVDDEPIRAPWLFQMIAKVRDCDRLDWLVVLPQITEGANFEGRTLADECLTARAVVLSRRGELENAELTIAGIETLSSRVRACAVVSRELELSGRSTEAARLRDAGARGALADPLAAVIGNGVPELALECACRGERDLASQLLRLYEGNDRLSDLEPTVRAALMESGALRGDLDAVMSDRALFAAMENGAWMLLSADRSVVAALLANGHMAEAIRYSTGRDDMLLLPVAREAARREGVESGLRTLPDDAPLLAKAVLFADAAERGLDRQDPEQAMRSVELAERWLPTHPSDVEVDEDLWFAACRRVAMLFERLGRRDRAMSVLDSSYRLIPQLTPSDPAQARGRTQCLLYQHAANLAHELGAQELAARAIARAWALQRTERDAVANVRLLASFGQLERAVTLALAADVRLWRCRLLDEIGFVAETGAGEVEGLLPEDAGWLARASVRLGAIRAEWGRTTGPQD